VWLYGSRLEAARVFHIVIRKAGVLPVLGRERYLRDKGRMLVRALDLVTLQDGAGAEYDMGERVTYLNDLACFASSMPLAPDVSFTQVDRDHFDVTLVNGGVRVTVRVTLQADGSPCDFATTGRFCADPRDARRLLRTGWTTIGGRRLPMRGEGVWHPPEGEFPYARLDPIPGSVEFHVVPGK
jgi:hypothetical protein